jgi:putative cell wall-binding protein
MKKLLGILIVLLLSLNLPTLVLGTSLSSVSTGTPQINRIAGLDKYETSAKVAQSGWTKSENAVLVTGENYPDALSAAPLAKKLEAPILLTNKDTLNKETESELERLGVKTVYIVGGPGVISDNVKEVLRNKNISTIYQVYGYDKYLTSIEVASLLTADRETVDEVILTTGEDFADAISVSSIAAKKGIPIILIPKDYDSNIMKEINTYFAKKHVVRTYIVGGSEVISDEFANQLPHVIRITGQDKYERNVAIINKFIEDLDFSTTYLATGEGFSDALTGSAFAASSSSPLILVSNNLSSATKSLLDSRLGDIKQFNVLGGKAVVSEQVLEKIMSPGQSNDSSENNVINTRGNSAGNIASRGTAAIQGDWIYYRDDYSSKGALYKIKNDGTGKMKLTDDVTEYINVLGDWVYFVNNSDEGKIYKIKTDGTDKIKISDDTASYLSVLGDWIYYSNDSERFSLYKVKIDGSQKTLITSDSAFYLNLIDESIYYLNADDFAIYRISTNGTGRTKVVSDESHVFNVVNGTIFYRNLSDRRLYSIGVDGMGKTKISDDTPIMINSDENWIYYTNGSDNYYLYKIRFDGTERTRLNTHISIQPSVIGDWIYYINDYPNGTQIYKTRIDGSEDKPAE